MSIDTRQLVLGKHNLVRWANQQPRVEWAQALLGYIAELEQRVQDYSAPPEVDWEQAPREAQ